MNLPNKLTLFRLALTAAFVVFLTVPIAFGATFALVTFLLAVFTDYLDGVLARKYGWITDFGKLMDPLADKILTASAFICLIPLEAIPAWAVIVIIAREFLITGLRLLAGSTGVVLPAERLGKHKTAWQMATILFFLILLALADRPGMLAPQTNDFAWHGIGSAMIAVTVTLTIYSGCAYLWRNRGLIAEK
jgi:CDP-diacylglycerol---glycerol-3-phosphate 3-phosphatidyltransferase